MGKPNDVGGFTPKMLGDRIASAFAETGSARTFCIYVFSGGMLAFK